MADHDSPERFIDLARLVLGAFEYLAEVLIGLPIPIAVPALSDEDEDHNRAALLDLNKARILIRDEPIHPAAKRALDRMILDWFTAYDGVALVKVAGPAPWRLDLVEYSITRFANFGDMINEDDWGRFEDEEDDQG